MTRKPKTRPDGEFVEILGRVSLGRDDPRDDSGDREPTERLPSTGPAAVELDLPADH